MKGKADLSDLELGMIVEIKGSLVNGEYIAELIKIEMNDDKGVDMKLKVLLVI